MSYLVMARKWRPQSWGDLLSQDHVADTLRNAILHGRLAHAYLFTGPRGVGKTSAARILAKALNCEQEAKPDPCNTCSSCIEITESRSIDVLEIDGASNRGIDEVRNLRDNIQYTPARGKYRVYIIDEVHMLTSQAFNALLKTLEEPPAHVVFIFATTEPHKVPATIISRCQRFDFRRIGIQDMTAHLKHITAEEKIEIDDEALQLIARKAEGSMRDSQSILDQLVSYSAGRIGVKDVVQGLGLIEQEIYFEVSDVLISKEMDAGLALVDRIVSGGYDCEEFIFGLMEHFRNLLVARALGSADTIEVSPEHRERYVRTSGEFGDEDILRLIQTVSSSRYSLKNSLNPRLPLELLMVKLIHLDRTVRIEDILEKIGSLKSGRETAGHKEKGDNPGPGQRKTADGNPGHGGSVPTERESGASGRAPGSAAGSGGKSTEPAGGEAKQAAPAPRPESGGRGKPEKEDPGLDFETIRSRWDSFLERMKEEKITTASFIREGNLSGLNGRTVEVAFGLSNGFHIDAIMRCREKVEEILESVYGTRLHLKCIKTELPPKEAPLDSRTQKAKYLKELSESNPDIKKMLDDFGAEVVD